MSGGYIDVATLASHGMHPNVRTVFTAQNGDDALTHRVKEIVDRYLQEIQKEEHKTEQKWEKLKNILNDRVPEIEQQPTQTLKIIVDTPNVHHTPHEHHAIPPPQMPTPTAPPMYQEQIENDVSDEYLSTGGNDSDEFFDDDLKE